jgi:hypothetical protein
MSAAWPAVLLVAILSLFQAIVGYILHWSLDSHPCWKIENDIGMRRYVLNYLEASLSAKEPTLYEEETVP